MAQTDTLPAPAATSGPSPTAPKPTDLSAIEKRKKKRISAASVRHVFTNLIWPRKWLLLGGLGLILLNRFAGLILPGSTKFLIDDVVALGKLNMLWMLLVVVGIAVTIQAISGFVLTQMLSVEAHRLIAHMRAQIQKHILRLPLSYFDSTKSGVLVSRIMSDVEGVRNLVGTGLVQLIGGVLTAVVAFVILLNLNVWMTLLAIVPLALFGVISMTAFKKIRPIFRERGAINAEVTGRLTESLNGIRVIKGFNAEAREEAVFEQGVDRLFQNVRKSLTTTSLVTSAATLLLGVASILIMGVGGYFIMQGELTVGEFFAFTMYLGFLVSPIMQLANIGTQITEAFAGLDRMDEVLRLAPEGEHDDRTYEFPTIVGNVEFEGVTYAYEEGNDVLKQISFTAPAGTVTALVGSSGSGKTTLAGLVASFLQPKAGTVRVDGIDMRIANLNSYRRQLGLVLQDDFLFEGTIRENILFAKPAATDAELAHAVKAANVAEFTDRFEQGLDTIIGERGVKLSGGQRQRVAIARAILADPRVLILDEATSNLDTESEALIQESLAILMQGRTTFVIAHRLSTIRRADQILVIEAGQIAERGTHDELIATEGRYHKLYTYQARI